MRRNYKKVCLECGKNFNPWSRKGKFCSLAHYFTFRKKHMTSGTTQWQKYGKKYSKKVKEQWVYQGKVTCPLCGLDGYLQIRLRNSLSNPTMRISLARVQHYSYDSAKRKQALKLGKTMKQVRGIKSGTYCCL